jgi:hypothetical protein
MGDDIGWSNIGVYNEGIMAGRARIRGARANGPDRAGFRMLLDPAPRPIYARASELPPGLIEGCGKLRAPGRQCVSFPAWPIVWCTHIPVSG